MRHMPLRVGRIAGEAAAEMSRRCRRRTRRRAGRARAARQRASARRKNSLQKKRKIGALGNFGAPPTPPLTGSTQAQQRVADARQIVGREVGPRPRRGDFGQMGDEEAPCATIASRLSRQASSTACKNLTKRRPAPSRRRRPIGAAVDRRAVGRQEHRQRPAALLAHRVQRAHVDVIDVGPLLAIDLHVDEQAVHQRGGLGILEGFVRHHMAPMAGGVADGEQDRTVAPLRLGERLGAPGPPMHGIAGVLEEIGRRFAAKSVSVGRHGRFLCAARLQSASARFSIALNAALSKVQQTSALAPAFSAARQASRLLSSAATLSRSTIVMPRVSSLAHSISTKWRLQLRPDGAVERHRHRCRIGEREAGLAGLDEIGLLGAAVALDREARLCGPQREDVGDFRFAEHGGAARDVPADHLDRQARTERHARRFGIDPDVVFGRRRDIALAARRAAHDDAAADLFGDAGIARQRQRDIGQGTQRHQRQARLGVREPDDRVDRVLALRAAARRRIVAVAEAVAAVEPMRVFVRARQRSARAFEHGNVRTGDFGGVKRVARRLFEPDVAGDNRQRAYANVRRRERHQDRDRVVGRGVGVDEKRAHGIGGPVQTAAARRRKPRSRSSFKSSMSSSPTEKRRVGPPGAQRVAVR